MNKQNNLLLVIYILFLGACHNAHIVVPQSFVSYARAARSLTLLSPENNAYSVEDLLKPKGAVFIFWQYSCPCVKRYQKRVNDLYQRYGHDVAFYHVSSNSFEPFDKVIAEYKRRTIPLPLLRDETKALSKALNVKGTPASALLSKDGELLFLGWIDNEREPGEKRRKAHLEDAIKAYIHNKAMPLATTPMFGCAIR